MKWQTFLLGSMLALALSGCQTPPPIVDSPAPPIAAPKTGTIEQRLTELKIILPKVGPPPATLRYVVVSGRLAFVSGHLPRREDNSVITGRVSEDLDIPAAQNAARQAGLAILASLGEELGTLDRVKRVVKVLGLVNAPPGFAQQPAVINGCSDLFIQVFGKENGTGARSAIGVSSLPANAAVEIEAIFELE